MDNARKDFIYDRLNIISPKIEPNSIPNPHYISGKLVQCHICFEEVEKYFIEVNKAISILQRALNNSEALYLNKKDDLISNDPEISNLPSMKDRDAKANTHLKELLNEIKNYKNELSDLQKLESVIAYKTKTLTRTNFDIKLQLRIMESQLKLGTGSIDDKHSREMMAELKKSMKGQDAWEDAKTSCEEGTVTDPSKTINAETLGLTDTNNPPIIKEELSMDSKEEPIHNLSEDPSFFKPSTLDINNPPITKEVKAEEGVDTIQETVKEESISEAVKEETEEEPTSEVKEDPEEEEETQKFPDDDLLEINTEENTSEETTPEETAQGIDLDKILDIPTTEIGGKTEPKKEIQVESETKVTQGQEKNSDETDFASLLGQFN